MDEIIRKLERAQALLTDQIRQLEGGDLEHFMAKRVLEQLHGSWAMLTEEVRSGIFDHDDVSPDLLVESYQACIGLLNSILPSVMIAAESLNPDDISPVQTFGPKL
jgi:hypothetical protein